MAYRFRLISLFLLFFVPSSFSSVLSDGYKYAYVLNTTPSAYLYNSPSSACSALVGKTNSSGRTFISCTPVGPSGAFDYNATVIYTVGSKNYESTGFYLRRKVSSCPSGYYISDDGVCSDKPPPDPCESLAEKCETLSGSLKVIDIKKSVDYRPFKTCTPAGLVPGCSKGCVIQSSGLGTYYKDQSGVSYFQGQGTVLSETCLPVVDAGGEPPKEEDNPLPPSEPDEKPCNPGEYQGTVNGTKVCLPAKSSETLVKQETVENADGSKTEVTTTVKCEGGKCTVTETATSKDSSGSTTGTASKETGISQSNFCAQNPGSEVCKGAGDGEDDKSTFTGSCATNFKCEGDAVQCAIALQQHGTSCKLFDESNPYWQAFKDAEAGNSTGVESTAVDLASHVSTDSVIGAGACPADIEITVFNQTVPFALSKFCPYFDAMGMLIMLGAAVGCLRILGSG